MDKIIAFAAMFFAFNAFGQEMPYTTDTLNEFSGFVDILTPDKLQKKYSPDLLNVRTDDFGMITKRTGYQAYNTDALVEGSGTSKGSTHFSLQGHKPFRHFDAETDGADAEPPGRIASLVYFLGRFAYHLVDGFTVGLLGLSVSAYNHFTTTPLKKM